MWLIMRETEVWNGHDEQLEEIERDNTCDNSSDDSVNDEEVVGEGITEEEERGLKYERELSVTR